MKEVEGKTTTDPAGSSSSLLSIHQQPEEPDRDPDRPEVARVTLEAEALMGKGMVGRIRWAVVTYGLAVVMLALDAVRKHNARAGNKPVFSWGYWRNTLAQIALEGPPPVQAAPLNLGQAREVLAALADHGWGLRPEPDGRFSRVRLRPDATEWDLVRYVWRRVDDHREAVRALLQQGGSTDVPGTHAPAVPARE
jgi:hypothetical protein